MVREPVVTEPVTVQPQKHDSQGPGKLDDLLQCPQIILLLHTCRFKGGKTTKGRGGLPQLTFQVSDGRQGWCSLPHSRKTPNGRTSVYF